MKKADLQLLRDFLPIRQGLGF